MCFGDENLDFGKRLSKKVTFSKDFRLGWTNKKGRAMKSLPPMTDDDPITVNTSLLS